MKIKYAKSSGIQLLHMVPVKITGESVHERYGLFRALYN